MSETTSAVAEAPQAQTETTQEAQAKPAAGSAAKAVKVLVWDLDNTLWDGTLLEGDDVRPRAGVVEVLAALDKRGILQSIASKNDHEAAMAKLEELGLDHFFLYPQINWGSKAVSVERIAKAINIGLDTVAFIDDQPFEREEVQHSQPEVRVYDAAEVATLAEKPELIPRFITDESALRRSMYQADARRNQVEEGFEGPQEEFLATLNMKFTMGPAEQADLQRAEELTMRTNQLNTTGYTYNYDELDEFRRSDDHLLLIAGLDDKYGTYGKIGLALVEKGADIWHIRLLLMSCRVMSRGVGTIMLNHILSLAKEAGVRLQAEFKSNERNRMMLITYKFGGFREVDRRGDVIVFEHDLDRIQEFPEYVDVRLTG